MEKPVSYMQCDGRWGKVDYSTKGEKTDICESGCGPSCMAMVVATWKDRSVSPLTMCNWSKNNGFKALRQGTYYSYFKPQAAFYGLKAYQLNWSNLRKKADDSMHKRVLDELNKGNYVIACMGPGNWTNSGHFILLYGVDVCKDIAYVNDPASTNPKRTQGSWKRLQKEVKYYFVVEKPNTEGGVKVDSKSNVNKNSVSNWAVESWGKAVKKKILDGTRPKDALTREEMAVILDRLGLLND